ncbi:MAG: phospholipid carrier-dependent glycosyltransferase [bacterium]|nr:phospholipid carrier-dependent glycosyltransferase [bacterium]
MKKYIEKWQFWLVTVLLLCSLTRFWQLGSIPEYVFDEVYHAFTAKMYALNRYEAWVWWESPPDGVAYEWTHPPLAKVIMSWGITMIGGPGDLPTVITDPTKVLTKDEQDAERKTTKVLANSAFGWRFFSAVFGVLATYAIFLLSSSVFRNKWVGVLAAFLFTFDLLPLVQSRTAMNDIFAVAFLLFAFYFFTKRDPIESLPSHLLNHRLSFTNWILTALFLGCSIASKWTGLFAIGVLGGYQLLTLFYYLIHTRPGVVTGLKLFGQQAVLVVISMIFIPYIIYLLSYWQLFTTPIHDYKGNSLHELMRSKQWENDAKSLRERVQLISDRKCEGYESIPDYCDKSKVQKDLKDKELDLAFWPPLYKINPQFADRYWIWWGLQKQMWWYHTNLKATHSYQSQWWMWPLDLRPVWFYVQYCSPEDAKGNALNSLRCKESFARNGTDRTFADIYTMGNPAIFWMIFPTLAFVSAFLIAKYRSWFYALIPAIVLVLIQWNMTYTRPTGVKSIVENIGAVVYGIVPQIMLFGMLLYVFLVSVHLIDLLFAKDSENKSQLKKMMPLFVIFLAFAGFWLPWARSPRIMFFYHFFPPMSFFYPLLAFAIYTVYTKWHKNGRTAVYIYLAVILVTFVYFYPHVTGTLISEAQRESYYWLPSWK